MCEMTEEDKNLAFSCYQPMCKLLLIIEYCAIVGLFNQLPWRWLPAMNWVLVHFVY